MSSGTGPAQLEARWGKRFREDGRKALVEGEDRVDTRVVVWLSSVSRRETLGLSECREWGSILDSTRPPTREIRGLEVIKSFALDTVSSSPGCPNSQQGGDDSDLAQSLFQVGVLLAL